MLQLAVEAVFLEASHQLVGPGSSGLSGRQAEALERLAFDWALNAETYVDPKFSDLTKAREKVRDAAQSLALWCSWRHWVMHLSNAHKQPSKRLASALWCWVTVSLCALQVTFLGADITGAMAKTRLPVITARFFKVFANHSMYICLLHLLTNTQISPALKLYLLFHN
jgi:hypothetical protein